MVGTKWPLLITFNKGKLKLRNQKKSVNIMSRSANPISNKTGSLVTESAAASICSIEPPLLMMNFLMNGICNNHVNGLMASRSLLVPLKNEYILQRIIL